MMRLLKIPSRFTGELGARKEILIVAGVAASGGLLSWFFEKVITVLIFRPVCGLGNLSDAWLWLCISGRIYVLIITVVFVTLTILLRFFGVRRATLLTVFSASVVLGGVYVLSFASRSYLSFFSYFIILTLIFVLAYLAYEIILNIIHFPIAIALVVAGLLSATVFFALPSIVQNIASFIYIQDKSVQDIQEEISSLNFQIYASPPQVGGFGFDKYAYYEFNDPPYITLYFIGGLKITIYETPIYFDPPNNCGLGVPLPSLEDTPRVLFECVLVGELSSGLPIYSFAQGPGRKPQSYFTQIDGTVIKLYRTPYLDLTIQELDEIISALKPITNDEFNRIYERQRESR